MGGKEREYDVYDGLDEADFYELGVLLLLLLLVGWEDGIGIRREGGGVIIFFTRTARGCIGSHCAPLDFANGLGYHILPLLCFSAAAAPLFVVLLFSVVCGVSYFVFPHHSPLVSSNFLVLFSFSYFLQHCCYCMSESDSNS